MQPSSLEKSLHCKKRREKRKYNKQQRILRECLTTDKSLVLSTKDIEEQCIVFDDGNRKTHPIQPPDSVYCRWISVGKRIHIEDEINPQVGLTFLWIDNALPFIRLPRAIALGIIGNCSLTKIIDAIDACLKIKKSYRNNKKKIFTDHGKQTKLCCAGLQVSRNSKEVHDHAPFMENLSKNHWNAISWLMRSAEVCFETIINHQVISNIHHAKNKFTSKPCLHHHQWVALHLVSMDPWHLGVMFSSPVTETKTSQ